MTHPLVEELNDIEFIHQGEEKEAVGLEEFIEEATTTDWRLMGRWFR